MCFLCAHTLYYISKLRVQPTNMRWSGLIWIQFIFTAFAQHLLHFLNQWWHSIFWLVKQKVAFFTKPLFWPTKKLFVNYVCSYKKCNYMLSDKKNSVMFSYFIQISLEVKVSWFFQWENWISLIKKLQNCIWSVTPWMYPTIWVFGSNSGHLVGWTDIYSLVFKPD